MLNILSLSLREINTYDSGSSSNSTTFGVFCCSFGSSYSGSSGSNSSSYSNLVTVKQNSGNLVTAVVTVIVTETVVVALINCLKNILRIN